MRQEVEMGGFVVALSAPFYDLGLIVYNTFYDYAWSMIPMSALRKFI